MRQIKKVMAVVIALSVIMAFSITSFAASDGKITVTDATNGEEYTAYKVFDATISADGSKISYKWNGTGSWPDNDYFDYDSATGTVSYADSTATELSPKAIEWLKANLGNLGAKKIDTVTAAGDKAEFTGLDYGYYFIDTTVGSVVMVDSTKKTVEIEDKNPENTSDKLVQEDSTGEWGKENDAQVGDTILFKAPLEIKKGTKNVVFHDTMDEGLTFTSDSIKIEGLKKGTDYTEVTSPTDGCTFEIVFSDENYISKLTDDAEITVTYSAVLNNKAVVEEPELNKNHLTWGEKNKGTSEEATTKTTTHSFEILKYDGADTSKSPLAGATFELHKDGKLLKLVSLGNDTYRIATSEDTATVTSFTTTAAGNVTIKGVDADDDYTLVETSAPDGFNKLGEPVEVEVSAANDLVKEVENNAGAELPSTGGIGTTIFYTLGIILVIGGSVLLITRRRMDMK